MVTLLIVDWKWGLNIYIMSLSKSCNVNGSGD